ncbi:23S rRNA (uracil(1939)-C(5))-methyltransferase RlmD [Sinobacterium norvegicum]|uniref:23S rRNA (Uracil(1939)-C(5))-methyltransferase RlmD n=1 Tax=Sinobacterium norvegicum TaxID=1641715 RepID=A0ABN8EJN5_9GAMM|nr:23S rRNA (uracil(1939)-C(5))-methyltransferase RlmD [Sinobacterium norvegicum]CAH0990266.1 23S rRNA (uracil(1939)-C(5))-methyltransferase RlmD [Sinobacterium norvegicum]
MSRNFSNNPRFFKPKAKKVTKASVLAIDSIGSDGRGVARVDGKVCFVAGALPGETVKARWLRHGGRFDEAVVQEVIEPAEGRVTVNCQYAGQCGGCSLLHASAQTQLQFKNESLNNQLRQLIDEDTELLAPLQSATFGYRSRARLAIFADPKSQVFKLGMRQQGSKNIVNIDSCSVLVPVLDKLLQPLAAVLPRLKAVKQLGHVELIEDGGQAGVAIRVTRSLVNADKKALIKFGEQNDCKVVTIEGGEETVSHCLYPVDGEASFSYQLGDIDLHFGAGDFTQVNQQVNTAMVEQALGLLALNKQDHLLDLYCGVGNFSLPASQQVATVTGVEGVQSMVDKASHNAAVNHIDNAFFACSDLAVEGGSALDWTRRAKFTKMLLDPSREGAQQIVERLDRYQPERVVYVSCNPATLARDGEAIINQGYRLASYGCMDMFPNTSHSEAMALFIRQ